MPRVTLPGKGRATWDSTQTPIGTSLGGAQGT